MNGSDASPVLKNLAQAVGLLAGLVAVVYVAGAIVLALRLFLARLPTQAVVGELPREFVISIGMAQVLLPALLIMLPWFVIRFVRGGRSDPSRHLGLIRWPLIAAFLLTLPGLLWPVFSGFPGRRGAWVLLFLPLTVFLTWLAVRAAVVVRQAVLKRRNDELARAWLSSAPDTKLKWSWSGWRAITSLGLAYVAILLAPLVLVGAAFSLSDAKVCMTEGRWINGYLLGVTPKGVYVGEQKSGPRRIVFVPLERTLGVFAGKDAKDAHFSHATVQTDCVKKPEPDASKSRE